jgi:hypothetical protein
MADTPTQGNSPLSQAELREALLNSQKPDKFYTGQVIEIAFDDLMSLITQHTDQKTRWIIDHMDEMQKAWAYATPPTGTSYMDFMLNYIEGHAQLRSSNNKGKETDNG